MTRDDAKKLIMTMTMAYPNYHPADISATVDVWAAMLREYDFGRVQLALKKYLLSDTSGFAPSIGEIVEQMMDVVEGDDITELQAWSMVRKAIGRSGYYSEDEYEKLPPVIQRAVGSAANLKEWALMDSDTVNSVVQSHVIRNYRAAAKAMRDDAKLPVGFRELLAAQRTTPARLVQQEKIQQAKLPEIPVVGTEMPEHAKKKLERLRKGMWNGQEKAE